MVKNHLPMQEISEIQVPSLVRKIPWRRAWQPTPVFLSGDSLGQRSLAGYSPWGCKELDTIEQLTQYRRDDVRDQNRKQVLEEN